jgi:hypothetical protein
MGNLSEGLIVMIANVASTTTGQNLSKGERWEVLPVMISDRFR